MISAFRSSYETSRTNASEAVSAVNSRPPLRRNPCDWKPSGRKMPKTLLMVLFFGRREGYISSNLTGFPINFESLFGLGTLNETHFWGVDETWCKSMVPFEGFPFKKSCIVWVGVIHHDPCFWRGWTLAPSVTIPGLVKDHKSQMFFLFFRMKDKQMATWRRFSSKLYIQYTCVYIYILYIIHVYI